ncbi:MAG: hypothetical protein R8K49_01955 [Mariprofundaceae bacterium]
MNHEQHTRRKLLKMATYVPPAILGVMISGSKLAEAGDSDSSSAKKCGGGSIVVSANGNACCPCVPSDKNYDPVSCAWKRCQLGNCSACPPAPYTSKGQCNKVASACGCSCKKTAKSGRHKSWRCK